VKSEGISEDKTRRCQMIWFEVRRESEEVRRDFRSEEEKEVRREN